MVSGIGAEELQREHVHSSIWSFMQQIMQSASIAFNLIVHKVDKRRDKAILIHLQSTSLTHLRIYYEMLVLRLDEVHIDALLRRCIEQLFHAIHSNSHIDSSHYDSDALLSVVQHIEQHAMKKLSTDLIDANQQFKSYLEQYTKLTADPSASASATTTAMLDLLSVAKAIEVAASC
jgi:hypothetical protein